MKSPLHILHLEDDPLDASLVKKTLANEGVHSEITRVQNRQDFEAALERGGIDLILSDYALPSFDGLSALKIVRARWPSIPLIIVSGTLGEDSAIDSLKNGATDYVLKERLSRLAPAVRRAMLEVQEREEHRRMQAQFIEAQKMEVLGKLASGVAHDFNNILAVIMGYSELIQFEAAPDNPLLKHNEVIRQAAERAVGLTRQLLVFSRKEKVEPVALDLNEVVGQMDKILRRLIHENIAMTIVPAEQIGHIEADSGYVGQLLMNLVVNARDAMPAGGKLTIAMSNVTLDEKFAGAHPGTSPGEYVALSVSDTGTGMTEEVKAHMFEALFTTKPPGQGTGLGLATCQAIVEQFAGHIEVESVMGSGTTFRIYFPRVAQALPAAAPLILDKSLPRGTETLLVVEDDILVRHLARDVLGRRGYKVLTAVNGQHALNLIFHHEGPPIRLVISDVIMPLMGGKEMSEWLKATHPDLKILFTSGYTDGAITHAGMLDAGVEFLPKPYLPERLVHKVREMLDNTSAPCLEASLESQFASTAAT